MYASAECTGANQNLTCYLKCVCTQIIVENELTTIMMRQAIQQHIFIDIK